ncbi:hypothetical protein LMHOCYYV_CDS0027 [Staphylococcus phage PG-2021_4]
MIIFFIFMLICVTIMIFYTVYFLNDWVKRMKYLSLFDLLPIVFMWVFLFFIMFWFIF